jgi:hypothetical protein
MKTVDVWRSRLWAKGGSDGKGGWGWAAHMSLWSLEVKEGGGEEQGGAGNWTPYHVHINFQSSCVRHGYPWVPTDQAHSCPRQVGPAY